MDKLPMIMYRIVYLDEHSPMMRYWDTEPAPPEVAESIAYLRVPKITLEEARVALWPDGSGTQEAHKLKTVAWRKIVELCCKKWPEAVIRLVLAGFKTWKD